MWPCKITIYPTNTAAEEALKSMLIKWCNELSVDLQTSWCKRLIKKEEKNEKKIFFYVMVLVKYICVFHKNVYVCIIRSRNNIKQIFTTRTYRVLKKYGEFVHFNL